MCNYSVGKVFAHHTTKSIKFNKMKKVLLGAFVLIGFSATAQIDQLKGKATNYAKKRAINNAKEKAIDYAKEKAVDTIEDKAKDLTSEGESYSIKNKAINSAKDKAVDYLENKAQDLSPKKSTTDEIIDDVSNFTKKEEDNVGTVEVDSSQSSFQEAKGQKVIKQVLDKK